METYFYPNYRLRCECEKSPPRSINCNETMYQGDTKYANRSGTILRQLVTLQITSHPRDGAASRSSLCTICLWADLFLSF
ncbi:hypothetical protein GDO81_020850 [Engystomops pustulosus]|uniref:Uncharacterized protein n=1 Tax=Engystomops pustulosus TaxID=76066 RepID=A0AAV6ZN07_ENGPU|nr:hypothetical protein GDO81_020850 [Engystomops pustulosus]